uniref:Putative secreted protein n=1 Tax=Ixodes scapularis TaxID=6945 RepID=A0A4D5REC2_IXOSC
MTTMIPWDLRNAGRAHATWSCLILLFCPKSASQRYPKQSNFSTPSTSSYAQVPSWNRTLKAFWTFVRASLSQHTQESWAMNSNALQTITWTNSAAENCSHTK